MLLALLCTSCERYRIEYARHPEYYRRAVDGGVPRQVRLPDGTIRVNSIGDEASELQEISENDKLFRIREEQPDGSITLRAIMPVHVVQNTYTCIQNEEYELLWDEMLSERTKMAYASQGMTRDDFTKWLQQHREEVARTLNRIIIGGPRQEVAMERIGNGVIQMRLRPQVGREFKFKSVQVVSEGFGLKLLLIL